MNKYNPSTSARRFIRGVKHIIIYKATNKVNGKIYIGQTVNTLLYRATQHKCETYRAGRKRTVFHNAIAKYGIENFEFEEIDTAETMEELNEKESYWISYYDSTNREHGYNLDSGGKNCKKSESTKALISECKKEHWKDEERAKRMRDGLSSATEKWVNICKNKRVKVVCEQCGKEFYLPPHQANGRRFCSSECLNLSSHKWAVDAAKRATESVIERHKILANDVKSYIDDWAFGNKDYVLCCKLNNVSVHYSELFDEIKVKFGIRDPRSIINCVIGNYSKRQFAEYMKNLVT